MLGAVASPVFAFDCLIEPNQTVDLASPAAGLLERVVVRRADRVAKGQVLARLESRAETAAVELARFKSEQIGPISMAENKIEISKRKLSRWRALAHNKLISVQDSNDAETELHFAESELQAATENRQLAKLEHQQQSSLLSLRTIRSPFDGVVVEQMAQPGEVLEAGGGKRVILKLAQLHPLRVSVVLPIEAFGKVAPGMAAEVLPEIPFNGRYAAKVRSVDRLVDGVSGTFVVFLEMPNPKLDIPAGVACKTSIPGLSAG